MDDTNATADTLLVVRLSAPRPVPGLAPADEQQVRLEEELAFIQTLLAQNRECRASRVSGEELQALFPDSDAAFVAAGELQHICSEPGRSTTLAHMRLLLDVPAVESDRSTPLRTADRACQSQLIRELPPDWLFATAPVIGRLRDAFRARFNPCAECDDDEVDAAGLYRASVHDDATTRIAAPVRIRRPAVVERALCLRWRNHTLTLRQDSPALTLGRGEQADLQIESDFASRTHARVFFQDTDFILADRSTNGTFIQVSDTPEVCLQGEQIVLRDKGVISLGRPVSQGRGKLIYYAMNA